MCFYRKEWYNEAMKTAKITHFIIMGMVTAALIVAVIAFSLAWFQVDVATPYTFDIHANGVLYVYVDAEIMDNDSPLVPAVAIPGAIQEGLPYDVLTVYDAGDANPSYIQKVASVTSVKGKFGVNNEGYAYDKIPLPQDEDGYTLYPVVDSYGYVVWNNPSDHSLGWQTKRKGIEFENKVAVEWSVEPDYEPVIDDSGKVVWNDDMTVFDFSLESSDNWMPGTSYLPTDSQGYAFFPVIDSNGYVVWNDPSDHSLGWQQTKRAIYEGDVFIDYVKNDKIYEPQIDATGRIIWKAGTYYASDFYLGEQYWTCKEVVREGSSECTVHLSMRFKASDDNTVNDYYDPVDFSIRRLYITRTDEEIAEGVGMGAMYGNSGVPFVEQSADKSTCTYLMYGSEEFYLHAEVYLTQPDELMNPVLRGKSVYMVVAVSVEVTQFGGGVGEEP